MMSTRSIAQNARRLNEQRERIGANIEEEYEEENELESHRTRSSSSSMHANVSATEQTRRLELENSDLRRRLQTHEDQIRNQTFPLPSTVASTSVVSATNATARRGLGAMGFGLQTNDDQTLFAENFLLLARNYTKIALPRNITGISCVADSIVKDSRQLLLLNVIIMTFNDKNITQNHDGYSAWLISEYDIVTGTYLLIEQKVEQPRKTQVTLCQLRECAAIRTTRLDAVRLGLETCPGVFTCVNDWCGIDLEYIDSQTDEPVHVVRRAFGPGNMIGEIRAVVTTKRKARALSGDEDEEISRVAAPAMYSKEIMAITKEQHSRLTVAQVVIIAHSGSRLLPESNEDVAVLCCSMSQTEVKQLLTLQFPDLRSFCLCTKLEMEKGVLDKTRVRILQNMTTMEAMMAFKLGGMLCDRLFGFSSRLKSL